MIERIGMRAAEFVGSTAKRVAGAAEEVVNDRRAPKHRVLKVALPAIAAGAAAVAAAGGAVSRRGGPAPPPPRKRSHPAKSSASRSGGTAQKSSASRSGGTAQKS